MKEKLDSIATASTDEMIAANMAFDVHAESAKVITNQNAYVRPVGKSILSIGTMKQ